MAEEAGKVRLVRCPKCENLLPELPDFSLYQCGGCGAVLKGKTKGIPEDVFLEPFNDLKGARISGEGSVITASEVEMESSNGIKSSILARIHKERAAIDRSSTSLAESKESVADSDVNMRGKQRLGRHEPLDNDYRQHPRGPVHYRNHGYINDLNVDRPEYANFYETRPPVESLRSRPVVDQYGPARGRYANFIYHDEGPSSYDMNPYYENGGGMGHRSHNLNGTASTENLENGRAELLRKLDELKDQLSQSCEVSDKPKHHSVYVQEGLSRSHGLNINKQPLSPEELEARYLSQMYGSRFPEPYPQRRYPHEFLGYAPPRVPRSHYMHQPYHENYPGYYEDVDPDHIMLHRHKNLFHQPACSCSHCYNKNLDLPRKVETSGFHDRRYQNEPSHPDFQYRPQGYGSGNSNVHPLHPRESLILNSSDQDIEKDGLSYHRPRKVVRPHKNGKLWHPIAGGAPFVTCSSCFELLILPRKHILLAKNQQKMKCGACSSTILFEFGNSGYVLSNSIRVEEVLTEIDDGSSGTGDENARYWHGGSNSVDMNALSNDYEDSQSKLTPMDQKPYSGESEKQLMEPLSRDSSLSENEQRAVKLPSEQHVSSSPIMDSVQVKSDLPSQKFHDNCSDNVVASCSENGSKSKRSEQEKFSDIGITSRQISLKDASVATEMDVSLTEFSNSCVSQDSVDTSKEDLPKANKGGDTFFAGLIKKSFKKSNSNVEVGESQVYVNGHLISDRAVKKAEKLAGPIQPGNYWYDVEAGFWGVMGYPCLGLVMPDIEEFNYPMPDNCAAGNTKIFVNGRELHEKDLDLLASRGLPITRNRSYTIEMSGKVVDDQTGEELDGLGKLAPTVEKAKHGFGMRVPKFITQAQS